MGSITEGLQHHHKFCDEIFAEAEDAAHERRWSDCRAAFGRFRAQLEAHFSAEEGIVFPAFEQRSGMLGGGPTQVMRMEHEQMRGLLAQMASAVEASDGENYAGAAETLLVLMQQHNMKEENILYPMCDQVLGGDAKLLEQLAGALGQAPAV